jgi:hypothetical protein
MTTLNGQKVIQLMTKSNLEYSLYYFVDLKSVVNACILIIPPVLNMSILDIRKHGDRRWYTAVFLKIK